MTAKQAVKKIIQGNINYAQNTPNEDFDSLFSGQTPQVTMVVTMVGCSDSRISSHLFYMDTKNYIFHIRNIGNQIPTAEGSVDYGIFHLNTPVLLILGHTGCGAVHATLDNYSTEKNPIKKELDTLKANYRENFEEENLLLKNAKYAQINIDAQVSLAVKKYKDKVAKGDLVVVGAMLDFHDIYSKNRGEIHIININGEKDTESIRFTEALSGLDSNIRDKKVKRI